MVPRILTSLGTLAGALAAYTAERGPLPIVLFENHGQAPHGVRFVLQYQHLRAFYRNDAVLFRDGATSITVRFPGRSPSAQVTALEPADGRVNFLHGDDPARWIRDLTLYSGLAYRGLYPGIDMVWRAHNHVLKSEFVVAPGADVRAIKLKYSGMASVSVGVSGCLLLRTSSGIISEDAPVAYTIGPLGRTAVRTNFRVAHGQVGFDVAPYDRTATLVIDPVLSYSTLLSGSGHDSATSIAVDAAGNAYMAGWTESFDFPVTGGLARGSGIDGFVAKFTSSNALAYCTYIGGSYEDRITGIAVDSSGNAVLAGYTSSPDMPVLKPLQSALRGTRNAYVAKLNAVGNALLFGTYFGGSGADVAAGLEMDNLGNIYVAGNTSSQNFPVLSAFQSSKTGQQNGFVFKLDSTGSTLLYSTFLGGSNLDTVTAIAVDSTGSAYVTGNTLSTDFPVLSAYQASIPGKESPFVTKLRADGKALIYSTFLGGSGGGLQTPETANSIAVDSLGAAYVAGVTSSTDFPVVNPYQVISSGGTHGFVAKLNPSGNALLYSTYFGGSGRDWPNGIVVSSAGSVYFCGYTSSTDFPILNAFQSSNAGVYDAFLVRLDSNGLPVYSTYLGGSAIDSADAIATDGNGHVFIAGHTMSNDFPLVSPLQSVNLGKYAAFLTVLNSYTISGQVTFSGAGLSAVGVNLSGSQSGATSTDGSGNYSFSGLAGGGNYTVTPSRSGYNFSPPSQTFNNLSANQTANFTASANLMYGISGQVTLSGAGLSGVNVILGGSQSSSTSTDGSGNYTFSGVAGGGNYTVRPLRGGYRFSPSSQTFSTLSGNQTANFAAAVAVIGDFDGNGVPDLVWQNALGQVQMNYFGGAGGAASQGWCWLKPDAINDWRIVAVADFDGNGVPDPVWQNALGQVLVNYYGGAGGCSYIGYAWLKPDAINDWRVVAAADFDGNGVPDLVWQNAAGQVVVNYYAGVNGSTYIGYAWLKPDPINDWHVVAAADFDGNGVPDLVWSRQSTGEVLLNYYGGAGGAAYQGWNWLHQGGIAGWRVVAVADFDRNGVPDLVWQNAAGQVVVNYFGGVGGSAGGSTYLGYAWLKPDAISGWRVVGPR